MKTTIHLDSSCILIQHQPLFHNHNNLICPSKKPSIPSVKFIYININFLNSSDNSSSNNIFHQSKNFLNQFDSHFTRYKHILASVQLHIMLQLQLLIELNSKTLRAQIICRLSFLVLIIFQLVESLFGVRVSEF